MCTSSSKVTHVCLLNLDSMASHSHHSSVLCQNPTTKQSVPLPIRSVHIKPLPDETSKTDVLHGISRPKPKNSTSNGNRTPHHAWTTTPGTITCTAEDSQLLARILATRIAKTALSSPDLLSLRIWWSYKLTRTHTRRRVFVSSPRIETRRHAPSTRQRTDADVIRWHHHSTSACHARPRPRQRMCCPICYPTQKLRTDPNHASVDFNPGLVDFDFLRWPLTISQNFQKGLSCSFFRVDSNFGLRFFIWSSEIGQLAHSLWFLQRHFSRHLQVIFSCLFNLKPSSSFRLEFEGGC